MDMWIIDGGDAYAITDGTEDEHGFKLTNGKRLRRDEYGYEWIFVEGFDQDDAIANAARFDERSHPAQVEMEMFASLYRDGAVYMVGQPSDAYDEAES